jgi:hypothetical protein
LDPLFAVVFPAGVGVFPAVVFPEGVALFGAAGCLLGAAADSGLALPKGDSFKSNCAAVAAGAMVTSRLILSKPSISTVMVQAPSSRFGKL